MMTDPHNKSQQPEFGTNGAVLNAPTMSDELRTKYSEAEAPLRTAIKYRPVTVGFFIGAVFVAGFALGLDQGGAENTLQAGDYYRIACILLFSGLAYETLSRHNLKKRKEKSAESDLY